MFGKKNDPEYTQELEDTIDSQYEKIEELEEEIATYDLEQENREGALQAAMLVHGYLDDDANFGTAESCLEVVTSAQMFYDFLSGEAEFDYSHLLVMEDFDEPSEGGTPAQEAQVLPTHH